MQHSVQHLVLRPPTSAVIMSTLAMILSLAGPEVPEGDSDAETLKLSDYITPPVSRPQHIIDVQDSPDWTPTVLDTSSEPMSPEIDEEIEPSEKLEEHDQQVRQDIDNNEPDVQNTLQDSESGVDKASNVSMSRTSSTYSFVSSFSLPTPMRSGDVEALDEAMELELDKYVSDADSEASEFEPPQRLRPLQRTMSDLMEQNFQDTVRARREQVNSSEPHSQYHMLDFVYSAV